MNWVETVSGVSVLAGGLFCVIGAVGMLRMPDFYTRMHAASVIDTLGVGLILGGLLLQGGGWLVALKLVTMGLLIFFASPTASHALAKAAMVRGLKPYVHPDAPSDLGSPSSKP